MKFPFRTPSDGGTLAATVIAIFFIPMFYWGLQTLSAKFFGATPHNASPKDDSHA
jgi:multidrug efflux pump